VQQCGCRGALSENALHFLNLFISTWTTSQERLCYRWYLLSSQFLQRRRLNWRLIVRYNTWWFIISEALTDVVHTHVPLFTKQYKLVPAIGCWCSVAGKVTVGLVSHWRCITDSLVYPPMDSMTWKGRWAPRLSSIQSTTASLPLPLTDWLMIMDISDIYEVEDIRVCQAPDH